MYSTVPVTCTVDVLYCMVFNCTDYCLTVTVVLALKVNDFSPCFHHDINHNDADHDRHSLQQLCISSAASHSSPPLATSLVGESADS